MDIGIIGAGNVGIGIGKRLAAKGHQLLVSFARSQDKLEAAAQAISGGTRSGSPAEAARFGEVVIVALPWGVTLEAVQGVAGDLVGKVVWDTTNPLKADMSGLEIGTTTSAGEAMAKAAPGARVVKAVPPFAGVLHSSSTEIGGGRPGVFVCGDDAEARRLVLGLVAEIGADGVDAGPLMLTRYTEPLGMLLVQLAYGRGLGARMVVPSRPDAEHLSGNVIPSCTPCSWARVSTCSHTPSRDQRMKLCAAFHRRLPPGPKLVGHRAPPGAVVWGTPNIRAVKCKVSTGRLGSDALEEELR